VSELEVVVDRAMHSRCQSLNCWNQLRKGEKMRRYAVHGRMEVDYYSARLLNHYLPVVWLIGKLLFLHGRDGGG